MATFGETLKRERELRKITLREVSEATKIGLRYLEALEGNRFDRLPGGLFNKGFIRAYAKFIGLDSEALINAYLFDLAGQQGPRPARPRYEGPKIVEAAPPPPPEKKALGLSRHKALLGVGAAASLVLLSGFYLITFRGSPAVEEKSDAPVPPREVAESGGGPATEAPAMPPEPAPEPAPAVTASGGTETPLNAPPLAAATPPAEEPPEEIRLSLSTSETTWISLSCDGIERINREIPEENTVMLSCRREILLSTGNAGTMTLRVNGNECLPLGERGAVIHDFLIDRERATEICPPPAQEP